MATGDKTDFLSRIKAVLPAGWFPDVTPVLDGLLSGPAYAWSWLYAMLAYVKLQTRLATISAPFLDMLALDFFGAYLRRRVNETDAILAARIKLEFFRQKGTRPDMVQAITDFTGSAPVIFEPGYANDTGAYNYGATLGYGVAGAYGNLNLPFQAFMQITRPHGSGIASVVGYGHVGGFNGMPGGYGAGAFEYATPSLFAPVIADADIFAVVNDVRPAGTIMWVALTSGGGGGNAPLDTFILDTNVLV